MKPNEIFKGFSPEEQAKHEEYLLKRYGAKMKSSLAEAEKKTKNWKNDDWQRTKLEFDAICKDLVHVLKEQADPSSPEVQVIIQRHYDWLKQFWTPNRESYAGHADLILESELRKAYEAYDQELPEFVAKSIKIFAERQLK